MCFSENASIVSLMTGLIGAILCISLGGITDKIVGFFLGFVALMQGIEYLLWKHQKCDDYNRSVSLLGMLFNHLQPIVLGLVIININTELKETYKNLIIIIMILYLCFIIPYSIQFIDKDEEQCTIKNEETKHLLWNWNLQNCNYIIYLIFLFTLCVLSLLGFPTLESKIMGTVTTIVTFTSSLILYPNDHVGALWCYYTAYLPIIYYIIFS